jgi:hypothetical protein
MLIGIMWTMPLLSQSGAPKVGLPRNQEFRMKAFVMGLPRSGMLLQYLLSLSAVGFTVGLSESDLYASRFGKLRLIKNIERILGRTEENAYSLSFFWNSKLSMKVNTPLGRTLVKITPWELWN